jgi:hypothetical protein
LSTGVGYRPHVRLVCVLVVFACGGSGSEPPPPRFDRARLELLSAIEVPGFVGDIVPGMIESHANRRYTGRVATLPDDVGVVVSYGVCDLPCTPTDVDSFRSTHKDSELVPRDIRTTKPDLEITPTLVGGRPAVAVFGRGFAKGNAFGRLTVFYNNGVNELRVTATIWKPVAGIASSDDVRVKLPRAGFDTAVQPFLVAFAPFY